MDNGITQIGDRTSSQFRVRRRDKHDTVILRVSGTVDVVTAPTLATHLDVALTAESARVVVDLLQVDLISAAGIRVLVETHRLARKAGIALRVVSDGPGTSRLMHLIGIDDVIDLYTTLPAALRR